MPVDKAYMTHLPTLFAALLATDGAVLELGAGFVSTPLLRTFCAAANRHFISLDDDLNWALACSSVHCRDYFTLPVYVESCWSVVFIDNAPASRRAADALLFRQSAEFVVIHDWESPEIGFAHPWPYSRVDRRQPQTIVLSNKEIPW